MKIVKKILMALVIGILSAFMLWYTLSLCKCLMNSDSAFIIDYAELMIKYKSLFPKTWVNTNDFWVYSLIPQLAVFLKMGIKMFIARQLSVIVQTIALFAVIIWFYKTINIKRGVFAFFVLLMSGVSAQFMFEMFGDGQYAAIVLYILLGLTLFIKYHQTSKIGYTIALFFLLVFLCGCSLRFPILLVAPLFVCLFFMAYANKKITREHIISFISIVFGFIFGYLLYRLLSNFLMVYSYIDREIIGDSYNLTNAVFGTIFDFLYMNGATGKANSTLGKMYHTFITSTSISILIPFIKLVFAIFTVVIPYKISKKVNKLSQEEKIVNIFVVSSSLILLFFLIIADMYWARYHVTLIFFLLLLHPIFYDLYIDSDKVKKIVYSTLIGLVSIASIVLVLDSTIDFKTHQQKVNQYQGLTNFLLEKDLHMGYNARDNEHNIFHLLSNGDLRIARLSRALDMPYYWLSSTDWFDEDYYKGNVFFINNPSYGDLEFTAVQEKALMVYNYGNYNIYVLENMNVLLNQLTSTHYAPVKNWDEFWNLKDYEKKKSILDLFKSVE